jgi:hypothetical protein
MAAATVSQRFTAVLGPMKMEVISLSSATDTNTVDTLIQSPQFAFAVNTSDAGTTSLAINVAISGKQLTLNNANLAANTVIVVAFGF